MRLHSVDHGFCRVYYRRGRQLLCYQLAGWGNYELYTCTADGEPSHPITPVAVPARHLPIEVNSTCADLRKWLEKEGLICEDES